MISFSRRDFLKVSASALFSLAFKPLPPDETGPARLGRVTTDYLRVYLRPSPTANAVGSKGLDDVIEVYDDLTGEDGRTWHEIAGGYVQSAEVQPVKRVFNTVVPSVHDGFIGEITVPFTDARRKPELNASIAYRTYYASTLWARDVEYDTNGSAWYKVYDERLGIYYFVPAYTMRPVPAAEMAPINPNATQKRIEVNLGQQRLTAFEGCHEVFTALISSGRLYMPPGSTSARSWTPAGTFTVERKRPTRHMGYGEAAGSEYELPGVPWVSYFHWKGFSFHGTWWHNDFGRPRSAGCINMLPDDARWLYRWSHPIPLPDQELTTGAGTAVEIMDG